MNKLAFIINYDIKFTRDTKDQVTAEGTF